MKAFNLDAALNGEPVLLRNGSMARVCYKTPDCYVGNDGEEIEFPLHGYVIKAYNIIETPNMFWTIDGRVYKDDEDALDIVGMWEEPELTSAQVLEKAYQECLHIINSELEGVFTIIGKTKLGDYILAYPGETMRHHIVSEGSEGWELYVEPKQPEPDTITVTLPKPFKPKHDESYYTIVADGKYSELRIEKTTNNHLSSVDERIISAGNAFRTEEHAQAWLDAMKGTLE